MEATHCNVYPRPRLGSVVAVSRGSAAFGQQPDMFLAPGLSSPVTGSPLPSRPRRASVAAAELGMLGSSFSLSAPCSPISGASLDRAMGGGGGGGGSPGRRSPLGRMGQVGKIQRFSRSISRNSVLDVPVKRRSHSVLGLTSPLESPLGPLGGGPVSPPHAARAPAAFHPMVSGSLVAAS